MRLRLEAQCQATYESETGVEGLFEDGMGRIENELGEKDFVTALVDLDSDDLVVSSGSQGPGGNANETPRSAQLTRKRHMMGGSRSARPRRNSLSGGFAHLIRSQR